MGYIDTSRKTRKTKPSPVTPLSGKPIQEIVVVNKSSEK